MNDSYDLRSSESHIEVHKFRTGAIIGSLLLVLFLQAFLPLYVPKAEILDLPLLITIYFGLSRRNPSTGLLPGNGDWLGAGQLERTDRAARAVASQNDHRISRVINRSTTGYGASGGTVRTDDGFLRHASSD
jgi:hypothetical protein